MDAELMEKLIKDQRFLSLVKELNQTTTETLNQTTTETLKKEEQLQTTTNNSFKTELLKQALDLDMDKVNSKFDELKKFLKTNAKKFSRIERHDKQLYCNIYSKYIEHTISVNFLKPGKYIYYSYTIPQYEFSVDENAKFLSQLKNEFDNYHYQCNGLNNVYIIFIKEQ
jgi:hypothetical protein